ncbi:MAG: GNAT family N-acetyltransferase [Clostridiales bacterium]|nr:GNAT family N-acetyltransferase [Clostridiales bacterium]
MRLFKKRRKRRIETTTPPVPVLQTERLVLRSFDENDAVDVYAYAHSNQVGPMAGWAPHASIEDSRKTIRMFIDGGEVWAMVEKKSGRVIGSIGLHKDTVRSIGGAKELGYALGETHWGQGYAAEASQEVLRYGFEELAAPIIGVSHFPTNGQSKRVIEKLGFSYEGTIRHAQQLPDDSITDIVCYSLLKSEYEEQKK